MASLTLKSKSYEGRYLQLDVTSTSNGSAKNSSTVKWTLTAVGGGVNDNGVPYCYSTGPTKVTINGNVVYDKERVDWDTGKFPAARGSANGSLVIAHNNQGEKTIAIALSTAVHTKTVTEESDDLVLDKIDRYATVSHSIKSKTETSVVMNWSSDSVVDTLKYSTDNGSTWKSVNVTDGKSGTYTITGLTPETTYKIKTRIHRKDNGLETTSGALTVTTYGYPNCISTPDFVIGESVTLRFENPLKRTFSLTINGNGEFIGTWTVSGETYTIVNDSSTERNLYESIPDRWGASYEVIVTYNGVSNSTYGGWYEIDGELCEPEFGSFLYGDTNQSVSSIIGNGDLLVQHLSELEVMIPKANKMVAHNGATPSHYIVSIDTLSAPFDYADRDIEEAIGCISSSGTKRLYVRAYDSRGNTTAVYKDVTVLPYSYPTVSATLKRKNNFENETTLSVTGTYAPVVLNGVEKNGVKKITYWCYNSNGELVKSGGFNVTASNGKFTCTDTLLDLDNANEYTCKVEFVDKFEEKATVTPAIGAGKAVFFISSSEKTAYLNDVEIATKADVQAVANTVRSTATILNSAYPVGSVFITNTNTKPSTLLGVGSWALIDKEFAAKHYTANTTATDYFTPAANWNNVNTHFVVSGHSIRIRQAVQCDLGLDDTGSLIGYFNWENFGVVDIADSIVEHVAYSDGANAGFVYNITHDNGECKVVDVFDLSSVDSDKTFYMDFVLVIDSGRMIDDYCDRFYWKRTS